MIEFIKNWFFFKIEKNKKLVLRENVMKSDHLPYRILLIVIMLIQALMFGFSFLKGEDSIDWLYRVAYIFLFLISLVCLLITNHLYKKNKTLAYFTIASLTMFSIMLWGGMISILDSQNHKNLTYFAIAMIAAAAFITLEPWVPALAGLLSSVIFSFTFAILKNNGFLEATTGSGFYITVATVFGIVLISSTFNFYRRINAIKLELEMSDLNGILKGEVAMDELTQVHNRRYLSENLNIPLNYGVPCSGLIMIDVDSFKVVNDTFGHQVGDECLILIGNELNKMVLGKKAYAVRYGGEEFLVFFENVTEREIMTYADEFRKNIESYNFNTKGMKKKNVKLTISAGVALATTKMTYNELISKADKALYKAKITKNSVKI